MKSAAAFARLERIVRRLAMTIGALSAVAVPLSFGYDAYQDEIEMRRFQARLAADRVAQYAAAAGRGRDRGLDRDPSRVSSGAHHGPHGLRRRC